MRSLYITWLQNVENVKLKRKAVTTRKIKTKGAYGNPYGVCNCLICQAKRRVKNV